MDYGWSFGWLLRMICRGKFGWKSISDGMEAWVGDGDNDMMLRFRQKTYQERGSRT